MSMKAEHRNISLYPQIFPNFIRFIPGNKVNSVCEKLEINVSSVAFLNPLWFIKTTFGKNEQVCNTVCVCVRFSCTHTLSLSNYNANNHQYVCVRVCMWSCLFLNDGIIGADWSSSHTQAYNLLTWIHLTTCHYWQQNHQRERDRQTEHVCVCVCVSNTQQSSNTYVNTVVGECVCVCVQDWELVSERRERESKCVWW